MRAGSSLGRRVGPASRILPWAGAPEWIPIRFHTKLRFGSIRNASQAGGGGILPWAGVLACMPIPLKGFRFGSMQDRLQIFRQPLELRVVNTPRAGPAPGIDGPAPGPASEGGVR